MKTIGIFLDSEPYGGGTFQYNQIMIDALAALPSDRFSTVAGYTSERWLAYLSDYNFPTVHIPRGYFWRAFGLGWTLCGLPMGIWRRLCGHFHPIARALLREKCDLWIFPAHNLRSYQFPVPALVAIHDLMFRYEKRFPESASAWEYWNRERSCRNICRWSSGVLVDSEVGRQQMIESYGIAEELVFALPFIAPRYMRVEASPPGFDERYRLPAKFLFYPAQFWEHKNHQKLIEAVARLKAELPDIKLVLAGSKKNAYDRVRDLVTQLELDSDVLFLGYVPDADMPELYRRARALVMPTFCGPTNIPPLEAFVVGCPVAASGIYGMPDQLGDAGLLFDPESLEEIVDCIRRLWTDDQLCAELSERGKTRAESWGPRQFNERLREIVEAAMPVAERR